MNKPLVTVLLPVYNNEKINLCIDSVLKQTFTDFELLIIDNASTDNTVNVIRQYDDKRIRLVVNEENIGPTGSLHKGIDLIDTKYIARIDADDLMLENRLEKQVEFMESNPEYGIVGSWTKDIDPNNNILGINKLCVTDKGIRKFLNIHSPFYHPAIMMRNSILKDNGLNYDLNIKIAVEYDLWNRILNYSKGYNISEILSYFRTGDSGSLTSSNPFKTLQEYLDVREAICKEHNETLALQSLKIERKEKKNIVDCIKIFNYLSKYLNKSLDKNDEDYSILKSCVNSRIYETCTLENDTYLGKFLYKLTKLFLS
ncbi:MAG: glycosyltransferase [Erysipelotrichaceae bacterium]|nr:glycosyltransferase [Erysipelotrichaceae bacterium]